MRLHLHGGMLGAAEFALGAEIEVADALAAGYRIHQDPDDGFIHGTPMMRCKWSAWVGSPVVPRPPDEVAGGLKYEQIGPVYNRAYDVAFNKGGGASDWMHAGVRAVAEWARKEALREAAETVRSYWDANGELIDTNNGARLAFDAVAAQIAEGDN